MWFVAEPAGLVWLRSSWEGSRQCETVNSYQSRFFSPHFCLQHSAWHKASLRASSAPSPICLSHRPLTEPQLHVREGQAFSFLSFICVAADALQTEQRWTRGSAVVKLTPLFTCCCTVHDAPWERYVLYVVGRLRNGTWGFETGRESGSRGPSAVFQLTPPSMSQMLLIESLGWFDRWIFFRFIVFYQWSHASLKFDLIQSFSSFSMYAIISNIYYNLHFTKNVIFESLELSTLKSVLFKLSVPWHSNIISIKLSDCWLGLTSDFAPFITRCYSLSEVCVLDSLRCRIFPSPLILWSAKPSA